MKKIILVTFFSSLLFCSSKAAMADIDMIQLPDTAHVYSGGNVGTGPESIDGDFGTYYGLNVGSTGGSAISSTHTFPQACLVNRIDFSFYAHAHEYGDDTGYVTTQYYVQWYNGSVWQTVPGSDWLESKSQYHDGLDSVKTSGHVTLTGLNLVNCSAIKAYVYVLAYNNKNSNSNAQAYIYEIQAWSPTPAVSTFDADNITGSQATLNGSINSVGGGNVVQRGFEWGTSPGNYTFSLIESGSFGTGSFSYDIAGLNRETTYYFRAKASNFTGCEGWNYGSENFFTTSCFVNLYDLEAFCEQWLQTGSNLEADLDGDGTVDFVDYGILANTWLDDCPADWPWK
ncbi:MAG: hypothetical protein PHQ35_10725 [Phycisphaerae bacterium]|nr:hypothetical protein [Phycisphaerae bacterium]MDD5382006.1 hypothetical protein [Phycisphaerae bacterium]